MFQRKHWERLCNKDSGGQLIMYLYCWTSLPGPRSENACLNNHRDPLCVSSVFPCEVFSHSFSTFFLKKVLLSSFELHLDKLIQLLKQRKEKKKHIGVFSIEPVTFVLIYIWYIFVQWNQCSTYFLDYRMKDILCYNTEFWNTSEKNVTSEIWHSIWKPDPN